MVKYQQSLDTIFSALADPTRRAILERLAGGEATVTEVAEPFDMSLPAVSKHVRVLENAGLIVRERDGRTHHLRLAAVSLKRANDWLADYRRFWEAQFDNLSEYLQEGESDDRAES